MALYKRNNIWWISISTQFGERVRQSTGTSEKVAAKQLHDQLQAELWRVNKLGEKPQKTWMEATVRWLNEMRHKRSLYDDRSHFKWLDPYLRYRKLSDITKDVIEDIAKHKEAKGVKPATVNRMLCVVRALLRKAANEWEWIDKAPLVRTRKVENKRIRWITREEADKWLQDKALPKHQKAMIKFTLATGLRAGNIQGLKWVDVDMERRHAVVHADEAKNERNLPIPLNEDAMQVLQEQLIAREERYKKKKRKNPNFEKDASFEYVFTWCGKPIKQCGTRAFRESLKRNNIKNFRWHDLRHTWASWHVQNGTSLQELQQLGGWSSFDMVLRYAHLNSDHLKQAAERIRVTNLSHSALNEVKKDS